MSAADAKFKHLGEMVLSNDAGDEGKRKVGILITQLAKERRKAKEAEEALHAERGKAQEEAQRALNLENENRYLLNRSVEFAKADQAAQKLPPAMNQQQRSLLKRYLDIQRSTLAPTVDKKSPQVTSKPVTTHDDDDAVVFESMEWSARLNQPRHHLASSTTEEINSLLDLIRYQENN